MTKGLFEQMTSVTRFKRHSINLDDISHNRCKLLAQDLSTSISGLLRLLVKNAYEDHRHTLEKQESDQSCL
jgi:hypothetical protein